MKTVFLMGHVPNPRMMKRIRALSDISEVMVICVRRKSQDIWSVPTQFHIEVLDIDLPSSSQIVKRWLVSRQYQKRALSLLRSMKPDLLYVEGLDSLQIAVRYKAKHHLTRLIYEVADLREFFIEKPKNIIRKAIAIAIGLQESKLFKEVDRLVVTSMKFYEYHYHLLISQNKVLFVPNMPDLSAFGEYHKTKHEIFTVGFIGGIRYLEQMKMLVDAAEQVKCDVLFAGAGGTLKEYEAITDYCKDKSFVRFTGKYQYEKEIASLYGQVDCVYAVYNADNPNVRIALPNKLYESIECELPIIVAKNTYLSEIVEDKKVGMSVNHRNIEELVKVIQVLMTDNMVQQSIQDSCRKYRAENNEEYYRAKLKEQIRCLMNQ